LPTVKSPAVGIGSGFVTDPDDPLGHARISPNNDITVTRVKTKF